MNNKDYLPSRQFVIRTAVVISIAALIIGIFYLVKFIKKSIRNSQTETILVQDVVIQDANSNGIPDWEERLWGLDPTKNGSENKEFILAKKKTLAENGGIDTGTPLTESDKFAREFFALITSLQQTGDLTPEIQSDIAEAIGKQAVAGPIPDIYVKSMLETVSTTPSTIRAYYKNFEKLSVAYINDDMGSELTFISQGLQHNDPQALEIAREVANSYRSFGKELMKIPTPTSLAVTVTELANNYEKTALSIEEMCKMLDDQFAGMRGIVSYKKYNDALIKNLETVRTFFERNDIIKNR